MPPDPERRVYYSPDNTRAVEIVGDDREAFLYDLTTDGPSSGHWVATGVYDVRFVMDDGEPGERPTLRQIELAFSGPTDRAIVDVNAERKVTIFGDDQKAVLSSLEDDTMEAVLLGRDVTEIVMLYDDEDDLAYIEVVSAAGREVFTRDGMPPPDTDTGGEDLPLPESAPPIDAGLKTSPAFRALSDGAVAW